MAVLISTIGRTHVTPNHSLKGEAQQPATLRCMWYFPLRVAVCRPRLSSNVRPHTNYLFNIVTLRNFLLSAGAENESDAPFLSPDGIKLVFDVVRNYGIALAVLFGALEFSKIADAILLNQPPISSLVIAKIIKVALYSLAATLFLLNALFSTYVFERTPFYRKRASKFAWAVAGVALSAIFSLLISGTLILAKQHAA